VLLSTKTVQPLDLQPATQKRSHTHTHTHTHVRVHRKPSLRLGGRLGGRGRRSGGGARSHHGRQCGDGVAPDGLRRRGWHGGGALGGGRLDRRLHGRAGGPRDPGGRVRGPGGGLAGGAHARVGHLVGRDRPRREPRVGDGGGLPRGRADAGLRALRDRARGQIRVARGGAGGAPGEARPDLAGGGGPADGAPVGGLLDLGGGGGARRGREEVGGEGGDAADLGGAGDLLQAAGLLCVVEVWVGGWVGRAVGRGSGSISQRQARVTRSEADSTNAGGRGCVS